MTVLPPPKRSLVNKLIKPLTFVPQPSTEVVDEYDEYDEFRYGWREEVHELANGEFSVTRTPLTLEDVLHPEEGDFRLHSHFHETTCNYLFNAFNNQLRDDPSAIALHDVRIAWQSSTIRPHTPDISVILGLRDSTKNWSTFDELDEGTRPILVVEVTSPSTRSTDLTTKFTQYARVGLHNYVIIDTPKRRTAVGRRLLGYELVGKRYVPLQPNAKGWLWLAPVKLWLGLEGTEVYCYDVNGQRIADYNDLSRQVDAEIQAKREAEARADAEAQAKRELELRLADLEAELSRLRNAG